MDAHSSCLVESELSGGKAGNRETSDGIDACLLKEGSACEPGTFKFHISFNLHGNPVSCRSLLYPLYRKEN